jgi:hypothetical protein
LLLSHFHDRKLVLLLFVFFFLINIISSGGHLDWWDGTEAFLVTESMVLKNTAKLDPFVPSVKELGFNVNYTVYANNAMQSRGNANISNTTLEPVYTVRSLLLSAVGVPFYLSSLLLNISPVLTIGLLVNTLILSLTSLSIFCISMELQQSRKIAFVLSLVFSFSSFIWPYNSTFWVQPLQALLLSTSLLFMLKVRHYDKSYLCSYSIKYDRNRFYFSAFSGFLLGLSVFAHPISLIFIPAFLVYTFFRVMRHDIKNFVLFVSLIVLMIFSMGLVNYAKFGNFTDFGYGYFSSLAAHDGWRGLIGLLVSPGVGLVFFFPIAVLLPLGAMYMYKENRALFLLCTYIIITNWIYIGTLSYGGEPASWSGGVAWGPRYLIPVMPFIMILLGSIFMHLRKRITLKAIVIGLCLVGFYINLSGILIWFQYGLMYGWYAEGLAASPNYMDTMAWLPSYSPIVLHTKALLADYVSLINPEQYIGTSTAWAAYGTAPCSYDLYMYCNVGPVPFLVIALSLVFVALLIVNRIGLCPYTNLKRIRNWLNIDKWLKLVFK